MLVMASIAHKILLSFTFGFTSILLLFLPKNLSMGLLPALPACNIGCKNVTYILQKKIGVTIFAKSIGLILILEVTHIIR